VVVSPLVVDTVEKLVWRMRSRFDAASADAMLLERLCADWLEAPSISLNVARPSATSSTALTMTSMSMKPSSLRKGARDERRRGEMTGITPNWSAKHAAR
jgi:hypothetical protein